MSQKNGSFFLSVLVGILLFTSISYGASSVGRDSYVWAGKDLDAAVLSGNDYQLGLQAASGRPNSFRDSFGGYLSKILDNFLDFSQSFFFRPFADWGMSSRFLDPLRAMIPHEDAQILKGIAKGFNVGVDEVKRAFVINELANVVESEGQRLPTAWAPLNACTSFSVSGHYSMTGKRLVGRNLDYPGILHVGKKMSVFLYKPEVGFRQIVVSPAGLPIAGISGMNEKGLVAVVHVATTRFIRKKNARPILSVNREVLAKASTVEEAIEIYKKYNYISGWMVHLSSRDSKTGEAKSAIVEISGNGVDVQVYNKDEPSVLANSYRTPEQKSGEIFISTGVKQHSRDRLGRLDYLVRNGPAVDVQRAVDILRDSYSPDSGEKVMYSVGSVRSLDQISSMVFSPDELKVYVADEGVPSSSGAFYEFSFDQMEKGLPPRKAIEGVQVDPVLREYMKAYAFQSEEFDPTRADQGLENVGLELGRSGRGFVYTCPFTLAVGQALARKGDYFLAQSYLRSARGCPALGTQQRAMASYLSGLISMREERWESAAKLIDTAYQLVSYARDAEGLLVDGNFVHSIIKRKNEIKDKDRPSKSLIRESSEMSLKYFDKLEAWSGD